MRISKKLDEENEHYENHDDECLILDDKGIEINNYFVGVGVMLSHNPSRHFPSNLIIKKFVFIAIKFL